MRQLTRAEFDALSYRLNTFETRQTEFEAEAASIGATSGTLNAAIQSLSGSVDSHFNHLSGTIDARFVQLSGTVDARFVNLTGSLISSVASLYSTIGAGSTASINQIYTTIIAGTSASDASVQASLKAGTTASLASQYTMMIAGTSASDATYYSTVLAGTSASNATYYAAVLAGTSASDAAVQTSLKAGATASLASQYTMMIAGTSASDATYYTTILGGTSASDAAVQTSLKSGVTASLASQYTMMIAGTSASDAAVQVSLKTGTTASLAAQYTMMVAGTSASDVAVQSSLQTGVTASFSSWTGRVQITGTLDVFGKTLFRGGGDTFTPLAGAEFSVGRNSTDEVAGTGSPRDIALNWIGTGGGYRHWISTNHQSFAGDAGNAIKFWVNDSATAGGSSAPNTGSYLALALHGDRTVRTSSSLVVAGSITGSGDARLGRDVVVGRNILTAGNINLAPANGTQVQIDWDQVGQTQWTFYQAASSNDFKLWNGTTGDTLSFVDSGFATFSKGLNVVGSFTGSGDASLGRNLSIGFSSPTGRLGVKTSDVGNVFTAINAWNSTWAAFGVNVDSAQGSGLGIGYSTTNDCALIAAIAPGVAWKPLNLGAGGINIYSANGALTAQFDLNKNQVLPSGSLSVAGSITGSQVRTNTDIYVGANPLSGTVNARFQDLSGSISGKFASISSAAGLINVRIFTGPNAGAQTYTPTAGTNKIIVKMIGGGGGGGGINGVSGSYANGTGGASGIYWQKFFSSITSATGTVIIGAGGASGSSSVNNRCNGGTGGDTSFAINTVTYLSKGGLGGSGSFGTNVPTSYIGTSNVRQKAGNIQAGSSTGDISFGENGSAVISFLSPNMVSGKGGGTPLGAGGPEKYDPFTAGTGYSGLPGQGYGSGGSGATGYNDFYLYGTPTANGGGGAPGVVIIEEYA